MEQPSNNEHIKRRELLVAALGERGDADPEVKEMLALWTAEEEKMRQAKNEPNYLLTMELARIFEEARWPGRADELLWLAAQDAFQAHDLSVYENIKKLLRL